MAKIVFLPTNGMNDKDFVIEQNKMTEIINMEVKEAGQLEKRIEQETFSANLNNAIAAIFTDSVILIPDEPFYPHRNPSDMYASASYIIPVFGKIISGTVWELHLFYETAADTWTSIEIDLVSSGVVYTADSDLIIKYIRDMMIICDYYADNEPHYVTVNKDEEIVFDLIKNSVARPNAMITFDAIDSESKGNIFTGMEADGFASPKLFRWYYTIISIFGDEGNPSPASLIFDAGYHKEDTDGLQSQWIESVLLGGMSLPQDASDKMRDESDKYRVYRQECNNGSSYVFTQPQFVAEVDILNPSGDTTFLDTIAVGSTSPVISFNNNSSPIARDVELVGESIMLSMLKLKPEFIGLFDYVSPIKITNPNSETYPNGITRIRLDYTTAGTDKPDFTYLLENNINLEKVRLFDSDRGSPLPVIYKPVSQYVIDIWVLIPMLEAGQQRKLYLAYCLEDDASGNTGVTSLTHWDSGLYGKFILYEYWSAQYCFKEVPMLANSLICSPMRFVDKPARVVNKANEFNYGRVRSGALITVYIRYLNKVPIFSGEGSKYLPGQRSVKLASTVHGHIHYFGEDQFEMITIPDKFTVFFKHQFEGTDLVDNDGSSTGNSLINIKNDDAVPDYVIPFLEWVTGESFVTVHLGCLMDGGGTALNIDTGIEIPIVSGTNSLQFAFSFDVTSGSASVFVLNILSHMEFWSAQIDTVIPFFIDDADDLWEIYFGSRIAGSIPSAYYTDIKLIQKYFAVDTNPPTNVNTDDMEALIGISNYMPGQRTSIVGYQQVFGRWYGTTIAITGTHTITIANENVADRFDGADEVYISTPVAGALITPPSDDCSASGGLANWVELNCALTFDIDHYVMKITDGTAFAYFRGAATSLVVGSRYRASFKVKVGTATGIEMRIDALSSADAIIESGDVIYPDNIIYIEASVEWTATEVNNKISIVALLNTCGDGETVLIQDIEVEEIASDNNNILAVITNVEFSGGNTVITTSTTLTDQVTGTLHTLTAKKHNNNISIDFDDIEDIDYKEHKNTAMYTNPNGMSFPPGNIKIADFPILRQIKTPTTLAEMRNSLLWFYRNGFTRYIADGAPSTWADATNLKIPQLAGRGLMAGRSLALTDKGIIWFAEKGIQRLNGIEPETISKGLDIPIKSTYTHWYCSLTKQYSLHDNDFIKIEKEVTFAATEKTITIDDSTKWDSLGVMVGDRIAVSDSNDNDGYLSITAITTNVATVSESLTNENNANAVIRISKDWVIDLETGEPTTFRSLDILSAMSISGGATIDNVILILNQFNEIDIYPNYGSGSYTTGLSRVKKVIRENYADFMSIMAKYGKASGNVQIKADIGDPVGDQTGTLAYTDLEDFRTKVLPISFIGNKLTIELRDAETLEYFIVDIGEMNQPI